MTMAERQEKVLNALRRKTRPYGAAEIAIATKIPKRSVWKVLDALKEQGEIEEFWPGSSCTPRYRIPKPATQEKATV